MLYDQPLSLEDVSNLMLYQQVVWWQLYDVRNGTMANATYQLANYPVGGEDVVGTTDGAVNALQQVLEKLGPNIYVIKAKGKVKSGNSFSWKLNYKLDQQANNATTATTPTAGFAGYPAQLGMGALEVLKQIDDAGMMSKSSYEKQMELLEAKMDLNLAKALLKEEKARFEEDKKEFDAAAKIAEAKFTSDVEKMKTAGMQVFGGLVEKHLGNLLNSKTAPALGLLPEDNQDPELKELLNIYQRLVALKKANQLSLQHVDEIKRFIGLAPPVHTQPNPEPAPAAYAHSSNGNGTEHYTEQPDSGATS